MELQQLRYFKALAENGNLTRTADKLHVTPPTLSNSISRLENELGAQLFDRIKGRLYLNEMGKVFLESSRSILTVLDSSCNNIRNISLLGKKVLSVSTAVSSFTLGSFFTKYMETHPEIRLINKQSNVLNIESDLSDNQFSFVISVAGSTDERFFNSRMLGPMNKVFSVGVAKNHPLAKRKSIRLKELRNERFIFPPSDLGLTRSFYEICRNGGFEPDVIAECNTFLMTRFVEKGLGVTFVASTGFLSDETIIKVPITDVKTFSQSRFAIYWTKKHVLTDVENEFLDYITDYFGSDES